jgi:hypothetical protein
VQGKPTCCFTLAQSKLAPMNVDTNAALFALTLSWAGLSPLLEVANDIGDRSFFHQLKSNERNTLNPSASAAL